MPNPTRTKLSAALHESLSRRPPARRASRGLRITAAEFIIIAGIKDDVTKKYPAYAHMIDILSQHDPSGRNKYLMAMTRWMVEEDAPVQDIVARVNRFHRIEKAVPAEKRDIRNVSWSDFVETVKGYDTARKKKTRRKNEKRVKETLGAEGHVQAEVIQQTEDYAVLRIPAQPGAYCVGRGTKWCISTEDSGHWPDYRKHGDAFYAYIPFEKEEGRVMLQIPGASRKQYRTRFTKGQVVGWDEADKPHNPVDLGVPPEAVTAIQQDFRAGNYPEYDAEAEGYPATVDVFYAVVVGDSDIAAASESLTDVKQEMSNDSYARGMGYEIHKGEVGRNSWNMYLNNEVELQRLNIEDLGTEETFDPEFVKRFVVAPFSEKTAEDALRYAYTVEEDFDDATDWIESNEKVWAAEGYVVYELSVNMHEAENEQPRYWEEVSSDNEPVSEQEPSEEQRNKLNNLVEVHFTAPMVRGVPNMYRLRSLSLKPEEVERSVDREEETHFKGLVPYGEYLKALRSERARQQLGKKVQNLEAVQKYEEESARLYAIARSGRPFEFYPANTPLERVEAKMQQYASELPMFSFSIQTTEAPIKDINLFRPRNQFLGTNHGEISTIKSTSPNYPNEPVTVEVQQKDLGALPVGTVATDKAGDVWTKIQSLQRSGNSIWASEDGEEKTGSDLAPYETDVMMTFDFSQVGSSPHPEATVQTVTLEDLQAMPVGTRIMPHMRSSGEAYGGWFKKTEEGTWASTDTSGGAPRASEWFMRYRAFQPGKLEVYYPPGVQGPQAPQAISMSPSQRQGPTPLSQTLSHPSEDEEEELGVDIELPPEFEDDDVRNAGPKSASVRMQAVRGLKVSARALA